MQPKPRPSNVKVDFGKTAQDYQRHRYGFPDSFFHALRAERVTESKQVILDLGTGTGVLARGMAQQGNRVYGLDRSPELLACAQERNALAVEPPQTSLAHSPKYVVGHAEQIPFEAGSFDVVLAGQCWHWFDRTQAAREVHQVLKPEGQVAIAHFDWLPLPGNVVEQTEQLILQHNPAWKMSGGTGFYPDWLVDLDQANFHDLRSHSYDEPVSFTHEAWRGRIRASAGVGASLSLKGVQRFDKELQQLLEQNFRSEPLLVPHRIWFVHGRK